MYGIRDWCDRSRKQRYYITCLYCSYNDGALYYYFIAVDVYTRLWDTLL